MSWSTCYTARAADANLRLPHKLQSIFVWPRCLSVPFYNTLTPFSAMTSVLLSANGEVDLSGRFLSSNMYTSLNPATCGAAMDKRARSHRNTDTHADSRLTSPRFSNPCLEAISSALSLPPLSLTAHSLV